MASSLGSGTTEAETRERLLKSVKKEVKQVMEEAVTRKFVHEESSIVTSLCGAVEACLQHGLRKRALGLFKNSTTTALLQKVSKTFEPAAALVKILTEMEKNIENARKSQDGSVSSQILRKYNAKYLWIRVALFEKQLAKIIDYLVENSSKYYEKEALLSNPVDGAILASLLVGPCALEFTRMKTPDHYWTDPPADELLQRHRIHSSGGHHIPAHSDSPKRPGLQVHKAASSSIEECPRSLSVVAKDYVESLHQNSKSTLLYGKNNVIVQPKEDVEPLAGYLSLHQSPDGLTVKWTPNQLMNGGCEEEDSAVDRRPIYARYASCNKSHARTPNRRLVYWDYAITVCMDEIVYLHCHQQPANSGGTLVLVGQDGVQRPPIHFPKGGHLLAFLSCLENGLLPNGQLDPPLWSQREKEKTLPKLRSKLSGAAGALSLLLSSVTDDKMLTSLLSQTSLDGGVVQMAEDEDDDSKDYVFRIMTTIKPKEMPAEVFDPKAKAKAISESLGFLWNSKKEVLPDEETTMPADLAEENLPAMVEWYTKQAVNGGGPRQVTAVKQLCDTMKSQILSRAFYGWLSHCRHLKTVRTHLSGLVNTQVISISTPTDASAGLTEEIWRRMAASGRVTEELEIYRLVYYGACQHDIRNEIWPYLLGHYEFGSTADKREEQDALVRQRYEQTMSEWLAVEAIIRQQEKETVRANTVKSSSESQDGHIPFVRKDSSLSNDVFESIDTDERTHPETVMEESSSATTPTHDKLTTDGVVSAFQTSTELTGNCNEMNRTTTEVKGSNNLSPDEGLGSSIAPHGSSSDSRRSDSYDAEPLQSDSVSTLKRSIVITNPSVDLAGNESIIPEEQNSLSPSDNMPKLGMMLEEGGITDHLSASHESLVCPSSPVSNSSNGGIYSPELLDNVTLNIHRIDKDVHRCDRNNLYFTSQANLDKLRNIMCTYVWENIEIGYIQGMCDLAAPLLVILDDEAKTYNCFSQLMKHMSANFPHGGAMDQHFGNMRSLIQILDPELFEHMKQNGDYTHFYFCYRWFLLDFKRELLYEDVFLVWETIWSAKHISSPHFVLFIALALVEYYREIIIDNNMDFTEIIKFFNEMAERHCAKEVLQIARSLVHRLQDLIENK